MFSNSWDGVAPGVPGSELAVLTGIFRKSVFVRYIGRCDVVVSGGDYVMWIPGDDWLVACRCRAGGVRCHRG